MLTNIAAHSTPRSGMLQARASGGRILRPATTTLQLQSPHHGQQTRAFRFGIWSSYLDPEVQKDIRRRQRKLKHKYAESLGRKLKWDQDHLAEDPRAILRRVVHRYMYPFDIHGKSTRFAHVDGSYAWSGRTSGSAKRENHGRVFSSSPNSAFGGDFGSWKTELDDMVNSWTKQKSGATSRAKSSSKTSTNASTVNTSQAEEEYVIDPITNRKVLKKSYGSMDYTPASSPGTFKAYRSQFTAFAPPGLGDQPQREPVHSNGPPPLGELNKYNDVEIEPESAAQNSAVYSEEYSLNHLPPEEAAEILEDVEKYGKSEYDQVESISESQAQKYDDLHKYNPAQYDAIQEKSGEPIDKYKDLHEYKPYRYNESASLDAAPNPEYDDLHKYRPYMHEENAAKAEAQPKYDDLDKYEKFETSEEVRADESAPKYEDLDKYEASEFLDQVKPEESAAAYKDLDKYKQPFVSVDDEVVALKSDRYNDLHEYQPTNFDDHVFDKKDQPFEKYGDLSAYKAYRLQDPDSKASLEQDIVQACLEEFDNKAESRETLEKSLSDHIVASDAADLEAMAHVHQSRERSKTASAPGFTGNFVRDFPEDFSNKWNETSSGLQREVSTTKGLDSDYEKQVQASIQNAERNYSEALSQTTNASVLETALDRQSKSRAQPAAERNKSSMSRRQRPKSDADPYSRQPQGLETSFREECGYESAGTPFVRMYGSSPKVKTQKEILAYDPTMQNVSIAETTSIVPDQATPLTPADVLLRLSNPTKFFPHFAPLQAQGFEIVSGSGDVLVFRKTRDIATAHESNPHPVNPIDMMGKPTVHPSAAAFASPTGFINYDAPTTEEQSPAFRSNIDVRREEPVFSGPKATAPGSKQIRKKRSITKRVLIGGVWIAGLSYALGVIGEYFVTGGIDGKGPTGF
ncbi:hypothetical protein PFICI_04372 [Pestalotiopsis fici W106-1]|uniref:Uncharacterized protein n=1 Tax=Pestalotiopsis fici (strain W106-1 / CGMCC3.15140) TaxID=1229662 RepID=W3XBC6_PESFW|nr:uncharacterized protein PFICI_04372 [Pestalotiopsis fici W106-1]ETS82496.1 hypothetical protein PFICI_04372 [Pestalotiopsis fici W106-1]